MSGIAILDDQKEFLELIGSVVQKFNERRNSVYHVYSYNTGERLLFDLEELKCDIYILDIEMPGMDGLQIAEKIRSYNRNAIILFVTSHRKYAVEAFDVKAYKYILKDQIMDKLEEALCELEEQLELEEENYYIINTKTRYEKIYYREIFYIYKESKNSVIVKNKETTFIRASIQEVYKSIDQSQFIFIDRGCIVNIAHIMKIYSNEIFMRNGEKLLVSRAHINAVKECVHRYWRNKIC